MTMAKLLDRARRMRRIDNNLVLCDNCDTPASKSLSLKLSWTCCAPCACGESDSFDSSDLIHVPKTEGRTD